MSRSPTGKKNHHQPPPSMPPPSPIPIPSPTPPPPDPPNSNLPISPEEKILVAWRKCASNVLPDGHIAVHPVVFEMMEAFLESIKDFKEMIKKAGTTSPPPPPHNPPPSHPLPAKPTKSWASAVKSNLPPTLSLSAPKIPPPNRVINEFKSSKVVIRVPESTDPFANIKPKDLLCKINAALLSIGAKIGNSPIQALGATRMQSGNLIIHTANRPTARWLLWNRHSWTSLVHKDFVTTRPSFPVLIQSVPSSYDPSSESFTQDLIIQNHLPVDTIQDCRWLVQPKAPKSHGSVIVSLIDKNLANKIGRGDLFLDGLCLPGKVFDRSPLQCHQCQGIGHVASRCRHQPVCARCGEGHNTRDCINEDIQTCARCLHHDLKYSSSPIDKSSEKYAHSPKSLNCPLRKRRLDPIDYYDVYPSTQ